MKSHALAPAVALSVILAGLALAGRLPLQNDAGSGDDAGNSPDTATPLATDGTYEGTLFPGDEDWFRLKTATDLGCADLAARGAAVARASLVHVGTASNASQRLHAAHHPSLNLATDGVDTMIALRALFEDTAVGAGQYVIDTAFTPWEALGPSDGGRGTDAGDRPSEAILVDPACVGGSLSPEELDSVDTFAFAVEPGFVTFSVAAQNSPVAYRLLNATGEEMAGGMSGSSVTIPVKEGAIWFAELTPTGSSTATYTFALSLDEDPTRPPCKPSCDLEVQAAEVSAVGKLSTDTGANTSEEEDPVRPPCKPSCASE